MAKYDGYCLKKMKARVPHFLLGFSAPLKRDVIDFIELRIRKTYDEWRKGVGKDYKIVKVKLTEVK